MELHAPVCTKEERVLCAFTGRDLNYRGCEKCAVRLVPNYAKRVIGEAKKSGLVDRMNRGCEHRFL